MICVIVASLIAWAALLIQARRKAPPGSLRLSSLKSLNIGEFTLT
jgi:hypothetical protein